MPERDLGYSIPFDSGWRLLGPSAGRLAYKIAAEIEAIESKGRKRTIEQRASLARTIGILIGNVNSAYQTDPELFVAVSRSKGSKKSAQRYDPHAPSAKTFIGALNGLAHPALDYIEQHKGFYDNKSGVGKNTRIKATPKLLELVRGAQRNQYKSIAYRVDEPIRLKDERKRLIDYEDNDLTRRMRGNLERINKVLSLHFIDIYLTPDEQQDLRLILRKQDRAPVIQLERNQLYRVFNNGSFDYGGRFYGGWWQGIPSKFRSFIRIDGYRVHEFDYSGMSLNMLYAMQGKTPPKGDPYELEGYDSAEYRDEIKRGFNALINAKGKKIDSRNFDLPEDKTLSDLIDDISKKHAAISKHFHSGIGLQLQRMDSNIAEEVILSFTDEGIPILPIHDSFIVRERHGNELVARMIRAYSNEVGSKPSLQLEQSWENQIRTKELADRGILKDGIIDFGNNKLADYVFDDSKDDVYGGYNSRFSGWKQWITDNRQRMVDVLVSESPYRESEIKNINNEILKELFLNEIVQ